jgi:hypothetical protein
MNEPQFCYVVVPGAVPGKRIGVVERGKKGYYLTEFDSPKASDKTIRDFVNGMNARLGVSATEAQAMLYGSMFGWSAAKNGCEARSQMESSIPGRTFPPSRRTARFEL